MLLKKYAIEIFRINIIIIYI